MSEEIPISSASEQLRRQAEELLATAQRVADEAARLMLKADELEGEIVAYPGKFTRPN